jgi:hypothetical protein
MRALGHALIAADVMCDGKYLGQITEAVVELARPKDHVFR